MTVAEIQAQLTAARTRGDGVEVAKLYFALPLSERSELVTAVHRGSPLQVARIKESTGSSLSESTGAAWPVAIHMHPALLYSLRNIGYDGRERGGFLISSLDSDEPDIVDFFESHNEDTHTWRSMELDIEHALSVLANLPSNRTICGEWHQHPTGAGANASNQDLSSGASLAKSFRRAHWVSLIIAEPDSRSAIKAEVCAYVISPDGNHRIVNISETRN